MKLPSIRRYIQGVFVITVLSIALTVFLFLIDVPILHLFELKLYDLRMQQRGDLPPAAVIALAMIDEKSLDQEGRWPWPRSKIAELVNRLSDDGAKVIVFDIGQAEIDRQLTLIGDSKYPLILEENPDTAGLTFITAHAPESNLKLLTDAADASGFFITLGIFSLHIIVTRWLFIHFSLWLNMIYPLMSLNISYSFITVFRYTTVERERRKIKGTFRQYVAPLVIEEMLKNPGQLKLGGEERFHPAGHGSGARGGTGSVRAGLRVDRPGRRDFVTRAPGRPGGLCRRL